MKNHEKDAKNRARSNTRIGRRAGGSVPGLDDSRGEIGCELVRSPSHFVFKGRPKWLNSKHDETTPGSSIDNEISSIHLNKFLNRTGYVKSGEPLGNNILNTLGIVGTNCWTRMC